MSEERVKPRSLFVDEAIALALESRWPEALAVNQALVERHGADEDTLNRIGKALTELGQREEALASYSSSLQHQSAQPDRTEERAQAHRDAREQEHRVRLGGRRSTSSCSPRSRARAPSRC